MALVLTSSNLEPFPARDISVSIDRPSGLLTSSYKLVAAKNFENVRSASLFGVRQRVKNQQILNSAAVETILKLSVFAVVLSAIL